MVKKITKIQKKKLIPRMGEISTQLDLAYATYRIQNYNPDDLVARKGIKIYKDMKKDDQIKATLTMKKFARLSTSWDIKPAGDKKEYKEQAEFIKDQFVGMQGTFEDCLYNIYSAIDFGFSITEKIFQVVPNGRWVGKYGLKALKTRDPENYEFIVDDHGNLHDRGIVFTGDPKSKGYPIDKFIIYSYNKEFSNWYGTSDLRACYRSWWSKEIIIRFYNIFLERFGMPLAVGKYKPGMDPTQVDNLRNLLANIQAKYAITVPDSVTVELLSAQGAGGQGYRSAIDMHNRLISRSILVPDLVGFTETKGGSFALGRKHFDVFLWVLKKLGRDTEENIVGEQIIKQLIDMNWDTDKYPKFQFESLTEEDTEAKARIVRLGVDGGFVNPEEEWVRRYLNLPVNEKKLPLGTKLQAEVEELKMRKQREEGFPMGGFRTSAPAPKLGKKGSPAGIPTDDTWVSGGVGSKGFTRKTLKQILEEISDSEGNVIRCPFEHCGGSEIEKINEGAGIETWLCNDCGGQFKITKEGDLYFRDKGTGEWVRQGQGLAPQHFILLVNNTQHFIAGRENLTNKVKELKEKYAGDTKIVITNH